MTKEILFSVTANDCEWSYTRGTGAGGQKKNKTSSAVHCMHRQSGAHGYAEDDRSQSVNRKIAFERMANSKEFQSWHKMEVLRRSGQMAQIDAEVERSLKKVKFEVRRDGIWTEVSENELRTGDDSETD
jgi:protein subunit release factor B